MAKRPTPSATATPSTGPGHAALARLKAQSPEAWQSAVRMLDVLAGKITASGAPVAGGANNGRYRSEGQSRTGGWGSVQGTQNKPSRGILTAKAQGNMRARCRGLRRDNSFARSILRRLPDNAIADGYVVEAQSGDSEFDMLADELLERWIDEVGLVQKSHAVVRAGLHDGDRILVKVRAPEVKTAGGCLIQEIEADRLVTPTDPTGSKTKKAVAYDDGLYVGLEDGGCIVAGVEMDQFREPRAYWIASWADEQAALAMAKARGGVGGGVGTASSAGLGGVSALGDVVRVDASRCFFMAWPYFDEPGVARGEPGLQAALPRFSLLDKWTEDVLIAADLATLFGILITAANPGAEKASDEAMLGAAIGMAEEVAAGTPAEVALEGGLIRYMATGGTVTQVKPEFPQVGAREFIMVNAQIIAAEQGLPLMMALFEMGGLTASNAKVTHAIFHRGMQLLHDWMIRKLWRPACVWRLAVAVANRELPLPKGDGSRWGRLKITAPAPPVFDYESELKGYILGMQNNLLTGGFATKQLGTGRWEDNVRKRAEERALERELGVEPVLIPGAKTASGDSGSAAKDQGAVGGGSNA